MWRANKGIPCRSIRFIKLYIFVCGVQQCSISVVIHKQQSKYVRFHKYITQEISIIYAHGSRLISFSFVSTQKIKKKIRLAHSNTYTHTHIHTYIWIDQARFSSAPPNLIVFLDDDAWYCCCCCCCCTCMCSIYLYLIYICWFSNADEITYNVHKSYNAVCASSYS